MRLKADQWTTTHPQLIPSRPLDLLVKEVIVGSTGIGFDATPFQSNGREIDAGSKASAETRQSLVVASLTPSKALSRFSFWRRTASDC